ncbi:xanthine dehydrogenase family protein molybdopterin-binding subunit [Marinitenerispora sediminis]|uniref:Acylaldehyde oxidase n=1 Tax=Marinitenerispora sediminis TaxID=1931232 RepID=A0A368T3L1_9ACTN|nr:xanthine dehydrogenase family protein molybdopterin-binding subunit [Marinitenerispora sediminis]RCV49412.1 acylaldehyde oxidase [Marinitenerispora sediminis]RCV52498.1 acylaldehyde oxidase [Marinitenerispora sediminis]RCV56641.1 acylaldehyde oxidase [Marinitenerispora sediminis]
MTSTAAASVVGQPVSRVDGPLKVAGGATYAAEFDPGPGLCHGAIVTSTVASGRIASIDTAAAEAAPGVVAVLTHRNAPVLPYHEHKGLTDPPEGERIHLLQDDRVRHQGQPVALAVAETLEEAVYAASLVRVSYRPESAVTAFSDAVAHAVPPGPRYRDRGLEGDGGRGDADAALGAAPVRIEAEYVMPRLNHNPIEPHGTVARWSEGELTLWDKTQWVDNVRAEMAAVFGLPPDRVRVVSPFVGGAFGSGLRPWANVTLAAMASRHVDRPVKVVLTRRQMFGITGYRPRSTHRVALGADRDGQLLAIRHEGVSETSTYETYAEEQLGSSEYLYACRDVATRYRVAPRNVQTPNDMRGPGKVTGVHALECAMDELAAALDMDPVELRLRNDTIVDQSTGVPFSSRSLRECYQAAGERFGWSRRNPRPGAMRDERGRLVGYGCASATWPAMRQAAEARARLLPDGSAVVSSSSSDMGPGTYTSMTQVAAETLGLPLERVRFELGDTRMPTAPVHGGSWTMASLGSAVQAACAEARRRALAEIGRADADLAAVLRQIGEPVEATVRTEPGDELRRYSAHSFGAVFAEVAVDPDLCTVRVPRLVGAYGVGRVVNPKTARSQITGGMVMGMGMALTERTEVDPRDARPVNSSLADYLVPVNADVGELDAVFVDEEDPHVNPLGVKGLGEIGTVGVAAAICNAVYHATGRRVRELPVTVERVLGAAVR